MDEKKKKNKKKKEKEEEVGKGDVEKRRKKNTSSKKKMHNYKKQNMQMQQGRVACNVGSGVGREGNSFGLSEMTFGCFPVLREFWPRSMLRPSKKTTGHLPGETKRVASEKGGFVL